MENHTRREVAQQLGLGNDPRIRLPDDWVPSWRLIGYRCGGTACNTCHLKGQQIWQFGSAKEATA